MIYPLLRPLLFSLPPEAAHHAGLAGLKALGLPGVRGAARFLSTVGDPALQVRLAGLTFQNPVGLAAGFDKNGEALPGLSALGFGFLEAGTVTPRPQPGNPKPRIFRVPASQALVNRLGFNNDGAARVAERLRKLGGGGLGIPLGVNIGKNKDTPNDKAVDDYLACLEAFFGLADFFVVNVSSPNTPGLRDLQAPDALGPLLAALSRKAAELAASAVKPRPPLFVKVSPDEEDVEKLVESAAKAAFAGIVATNTTRSREGLPPGAPADGGMSGRPLFKRSTEVLRRLHRAARGRLALVGAGGVFSARDAYEKILAGASLVEVYTGFVYGGPGLPRRLNAGLSAMLKSDGFKTVQEAVGENGMSEKGLIVALDLEDPAKARALVEACGPAADFYKVAPTMTFKDPSFIPWLVGKGKKVFLDCKWYDIPSQVQRSVQTAGGMGVFSCTVHTSGASAMMKAALAAAPRPKVWGVTVLTSFSQDDLNETGVSGAPADQVLRLALLAQKSGLDGLVCSPHEAALLRKGGVKLTLITPGISFGDRGGKDQKRTAGPKEAWAAGADHIVVGRSILEAPDPAKAVQDILKEKP